MRVLLLCFPMPLLSNKFSMPKITLRKATSRSLSKEVAQEDLSSKIPNEITLTAGDHTMLFDTNGEWNLESECSGNIRRDGSRLKDKLQKLEEENNLLRTKLDVVMNILTETTAESHIQEKELQQLRNALKKYKKK